MATRGTLRADQEVALVEGSATARTDDRLVDGTPVGHVLGEAAALPSPEGPKAEFAASLGTDALAPTNLLPTNPRALKRAFETGGTSVVRGMRNYLHDLTRNDGWPRQVDSSGFVLGENTAA